MHNALIMISLTLAYIPASNLIANRRLADCAANAVIASSVPIALTGIVNYILSSVGVKFMGESLIFSSLASYAAYLLVAVIFSLAALHESRRSFRRITLGSAVLLEVAALVLTMSAEVLFSALLVLLSYLIIRAPRVRCELVIPILLLPYLCLLLPQNAISGVLEALGMQSYDAIRDEWLAAFRMFLAEPFSGVGIGNYTLRANLPLSLLASLGACVTALLGLTYLLSAVHLSQYSHLLRDSSVSSVARTAQLAVFSSAALGIFFNVFADITLYFLSVCIFAIFSASMRIAKREHDDRLGYFGDQRSDDSYVVDMRIVK